MKGRIYDPTLGRFLQADPHIQAPMNSQSYNRYSYVLNNPLSYTDPSGFFFKSLWKGVKNLFRAIAKVPILNAALQFAACALGGPAGCAAYAAISTYAVTGSLKGALIGAFTAGIGGGQGFLTAGLIGGLASKAQGGNFGHGFWSAGIGAAIGGKIRTGNAYLNVAVAAVVGGTVSKLTGGKFANGAQTWAFYAALSQDWNASSNGGSNRSSQSYKCAKCGTVNVGDLSEKTYDELVGIRDDLYEFRGEEGLGNEASVNFAINKVNSQISKVLSTNMNLTFSTSTYASNPLRGIAHGMYKQGNPVLSDIGFYSGLCPYPVCQGVSGGAAYSQYVIYGDSSGLVGLYSGGFFQKGYQSTVGHLWKSDWAESITVGFYSGAVSEKAGDD